VGAVAEDAPWHTRFPGKDMTVHHVQLSGHNWDNAEKRKELLKEHAACVALHAEAGLPAEPLPEGEVPKVPEPLRVHVYYSPNRAMAYAHIKRYYIHHEDCRLALFERRTLSLTSAAGKCDIDLNTRTARNFCNPERHRKAQAAAFSTQGISRRYRDHSAMKALIASVENRTVAGVECTEIKYVRGDTYKCIAELEKPFAVPTSAINAERAGLLLELHSPIMTLRADHVDFNLAVSEKLFAVPPGFRIISAESAQR